MHVISRVSMVKSRDSYISRREDAKMNGFLKTLRTRPDVSRVSRQSVGGPCGLFHSGAPSPQVLPVVVITAFGAALAAGMIYRSSSRNTDVT